MSAGKALLVLALSQLRRHRDTLIKNETLAVPQTIIWRYVFQITQNTAVQLIDLTETLLQQVRRSFFTADSAGTKHSDARLRFDLKIFFNPFGKLAKTIRLR